MNKHMSGEEAVEAFLQSEFCVMSKSTFVRHLLKYLRTVDTQDIDWNMCCDLAKEYKCPACVFFYLYFILNQGLYCGDYSKDLQRLSFFNQRMVEDHTTPHSAQLMGFFCYDRIRYLEIVHIPTKKAAIPFYLLYLHSNNTYLRSEIAKFYAAYGFSVQKLSLNVMFDFADSFSAYQKDIHSYSDFNENVFFSQIQYYRTHKTQNSIDNNFRAIFYFYRYLVQAYPEHNFFANSMNFSTQLLFNSHIFQLLISGNYFITKFNMQNKVLNKSKVIFIFDNASQMSTRYTDGASVPVDVSSVSLPEYRKTIFEYIYSLENPLTYCSTGGIYYISSSLEMLYKLKTSGPDYPNKNLKYFTNQEAIAIKRFIDTKDISLGTKNNYIGAIRRFFLFTKAANIYQFDDMFFDYIRQIEEPSKNTAETVDDDHLIILNDELLNGIKAGKYSKNIYYMFHLALQTEFRFNQIRHLTVDCIKPTIKPNQYILESNSKTSHGAKQSYVISELTYKILMDAIEESEHLRDECVNPEMKDYIFLEYNHFNTPSLISGAAFNKALATICDEHGMPRYSASNLRDTHMTKAYEHILRNKKSDIEMSVLSKHRHLDTTKNHYIEFELEKMLESTYGIIIGSELVEAEKKIVDSIPEDFAGEENDVENGCGKCTADNCTMLGALPCMACKHFITTVEHERFFQAAIENIDRMIQAAPTRHDIDDLNTIKGLYVLYLKAIYEHKEGV